MTAYGRRNCPRLLFNDCLWTEKSSRPLFKFPDQYIRRFSQEADTGLSMERLNQYIYRFSQEADDGLSMERLNQYIYRFSQKSDTGLSMELLHYYIFISLDIFKKKHQNENIIAELDAWVTFLSTEEAAEIMRLCDAYPFFRDTYSSSHNTRGFRHEIRVQSDTRLHRGYILVMKNKSLRRIADVRSGRCLAPRMPRQERRDVLEKHISNLMISSGDSRRTVPNYR